MRHLSKTIWLTIFLIIFIIVTGFFTFQWWQIKGELGKKILKNESLTKQIEELKVQNIDLKKKIEELQKEIEELKVSEEKRIEEGKLVGWKTYGDEEYGFEIDYPTQDWELKGLEPFWLSKDASDFYIMSQIEFLLNSDDCSKYSFEEIIKNRGLMLKCIIDAAFAMNFEKEIITNFKIRGYQGRGGGYHYGIKGGGVEAVVFPILKEIYWGDTRVKWGETGFQPILVIFCDLETDYTEEDIEVFNKIISSFRYIE